MKENKLIRGENIGIEEKVGIGIPSHNRARKVDVLDQIPNKFNTVLFIEPEDEEEYRKHYDNIKVFDSGDSFNMTKVRAHIHEYFRGEKRFVCMVDDDVTFQKRQGKTESGYPKLVDMESCEEIFKDLIKFLEGSQELARGTISYAPQNWYQEEIKRHIRTWCFYINDLKKLDSRGIDYDPRIPIYEDSLLTAEVLLRGLDTFLLPKYAFIQPRVHNNGGVPWEELGEEIEEACAKVMKKVPKYVSVERREDVDVLELNFKWSEMYKQSRW